MKNKLYLYRAHKHNDDEDMLEQGDKVYNLFLTDRLYNKQSEPVVLFASHPARITKNIDPCKQDWVVVGKNTIIVNDILIRELTEGEIMLILM